MLCKSSLLQLSCNCCDALPVNFHDLNLDDLLILKPSRADIPNRIKMRAHACISSFMASFKSIVVLLFCDRQSNRISFQIAHSGALSSYSEGIMVLGIGKAIKYVPVCVVNLTFQRTINIDRLIDCRLGCWRIIEPWV